MWISGINPHQWCHQDTQFRLDAMYSKRLFNFKYQLHMWLRRRINGLVLRYTTASQGSFDGWHEWNSVKYCECVHLLSSICNMLVNFPLHMHSQPSFAHRLQIVKLASFRTSTQHNGLRAQNKGPLVWSILLERKMLYTRSPWL